jgi:N-acetylmuramoyl-L-alanine amidase
MQWDDDPSARIGAAGRAWARSRRPVVARFERRRSRFFLAALVFFLVAALSLELLAAPGSDAAPHNPDRFDRVVIDAGHGGEDEGATGADGLAEKALVLDVSRRIARRLEEKGLEVLLTRSDDTFVPLEARTSKANDARADLFVSIHANSSPNAKPSGVETYFVSLDATDDAAAQVALRENEAFGEAGRKPIVDDPLTQLLGDMIVNEYVRESSEFAKLVQHQLSEVTKARSRGVKQAPFVVLMGVQMPAALIEIGFISNPDEERKLREKSHRDRLAQAIVKAITDFGERADARRGVDQSASLFGTH